MTHLIRITTGVTDGAKVDRSTLDSKRIDWNNASDRKWLKNHMHWAMCNGKTLMLQPLTWPSTPAEIADSAAVLNP